MALWKPEQENSVADFWRINASIQENPSYKFAVDFSEMLSVKIGKIKI